MSGGFPWMYPKPEWQEPNVEIAGEPWTVTNVNMLARRVKVTQHRDFEGDGQWVSLSHVNRILSQDFRFVRGTFPIFAPPHC